MRAVLLKHSLVCLTTYLSRVKRCVRFKLMIEDEEEDEGPKIITPDDIKASCVKHRLYTIPELNEALYLHYGGYQRITALEPYVNLTSLWLNNNAINVIEGLSTLTNLVCLYLNGNVIEKIQGLDTLTNLETLCLSYNYISRIENLGNLKKLHTFEIDHNNIRTADALNGLIECPSISVMNMSFNKLETEEFMPILQQCQNFRVLKIDGNPIARTMSQYRRRILHQNPELQYLDDSPVKDTEVRCAHAYMRGGREEEMAERQRIKNEIEDAQTKNRKELRRVNRKYAIEHGLDISHDKFLMSSDDERLYKNSEDEEVQRPEAGNENDEDEESSSSSDYGINGEVLDPEKLYEREIADELD